MYYTLKDMAQLAGMNERTVLNYMQGTRRAHAAPTTERRSWQFTEDDLAALREMKLHAEQERTRTAHAAYTQSTDGDLAARVAALEATIERLQQRWPHLFAETRHNMPQLPAVELPVYEPPRRLTTSTVRYRPSSGDGSFPSSVRGRSRWVEEHGGPGSSWVRTWVDVANWRGPEDAIASVRSHQHWRDWSPVGLVSEEDNETPHPSDE